MGALGRFRWRRLANIGPAKMFVWVFHNILLFGQPNIYLPVTTKIKLILILYCIIIQLNFCFLRREKAFLYNFRSLVIIVARTSDLKP